MQKGKTISYPPVSSWHKKVCQIVCLQSIFFTFHQILKTHLSSLDNATAANTAAEHNRTIKVLLPSLSLSQAHHRSVFDKNSKGQLKLAARLPVPSVCSHLVEGRKLRPGQVGMMLRKAMSSCYDYICTPRRKRWKD